MTEANDFGAIAVVGMSGRFPGAKNLDAFWDNIKNGAESITFFSDETLIEAGVDPSLLQHPHYVKAGAVLEEIDHFDAAFFGFSPREAALLDPQQRLFMECAWEAIEHAGYNLDTTDRYMGVYAGSSLSNYLLRNLLPHLTGEQAGGELASALGNDKDYLTTHLSYKLNLKGPSIGVQTACSTSLVAISLACQGLLSFQCDMALAGGVTIRVPQIAGYFYEEGSILSPDGHCRAFDARGQGPTFGSGVGVVVLKRLEDARTDGDTVHAVIRGTAINNDGAAKVGFTAPSPTGQAHVIAMAQAVAGISAETIRYVEAHGTGTPLGDPIEVAALTQAFRADTNRKGFCALGSVKTNVGHLDTAAGVAGFLKTVLALKHKMLPPSLHFETPNPEIDFANSPFYVNTQLSEWTTDGFPRRAGVSSFGIGGTNAHVVLEEAPQRVPSARSRPWQLMVLSAKTDSALDTATANLAAHVKQNPQLNLADVAYTLQVGRQPFNRRRMVVAQNQADMVAKLEQVNDRPQFTGSAAPTEPPVVFMFPGQGTQYVNMGLELYTTEPIFREQVDICAELLKPHLGLDLRRILYPKPGEENEAARQLAQTSMAQPALFVIEYALARLWLAWGVRAAALIGHSLGEYVAACLARVFSLGDALALVAVRGRLMQQLPGGAMLAISLPGSEVQSSLSRGLSLAAINGPNQCVISGPVAAVEALQQRLDHEAVTYRRLPTSHAFHSEMMEPILDAYLAQVKKVDLQPPQLPYVSNLTGTWITAAEATDPHYWIKHIRQPVRFAAGLGELLAEPANILLEIGPGWTLTTLAKRQKETPLDQVALTSLPQPLAQESEVKSILTTLGRLWLAGVAIDWPGLYVHEQRQRLPLPTYPFERQRYWIDPPDTNPTPAATGRQADIADWFYIPSWKRSVVSTAEHEGQTRSCWLLFVDDWGLGDQLAERLVQGHHDVIIVKPGAEFTKVDDRLYLLNPRQREDYQTLLNQPILLAKKPTKIVHLWSVTTTQDSSALDVDEAQTVGFYSLLYLAQALDDSGLTDALDLTVISNQMQDVTGAEQLCPAKATMLGPIKVIPQEYRNLSCRSVDIEVEMLGAAGEQTLLDHLLVELSGGKTEAVVAYRGKHRWVQTFEPIRLEGSDHPPSHLKVGGVYLITGGLGGVGLALAEYLAQTVQANLILTGRSPVPTRAAWDEWLAGHDEQDPLSRKIRNIQALEALGSELLVLQADVTDEERMKWVIAQSLARFGQIDGVIHAAGVLNADLIRHKTPEAAASTFAPKLKGTQVLMGLCDAIEPNFMLFCASLSSVIGGLGLADYAAANAYLDAAAQALSRRGTFAASISWDAWREVGMAQDIDPDMQQYLPETGLSPTEGKELFGRILGGNLSHVLVSTHNLGLRVAHSLPPRHPGNSLDTSVSQPRPELASVYVPPHNETEQKLAVIWQELLGFEQVGIHDNFFELGGDSLLSIQVIARAKQAGLQITIKDLLQHQTLKELADMAKPVDTIPSDSHSPDGNISFDRQVNNQTSPTLNEDTIPSEEGWSSLVALQPQGSVLPLFCVHPLLGVVFPYLQLAHNMGREQPFYGLQAVGLDGRQPPLTCFEDMAAHYIKAIRTVQPDGPYCLGGWSLGSWIAFEMAQQLQAAGDEVGLLAIIDTAAGIRTGSQWQRFRSAWALNTVIVRNIWPFVRDYFSLGTIRTRPSSTRDKGQTTISDGSSLMRWKQPIVRDMLNVWRANMRANSQYSPQPYSGSITVFRAIEENYQKGTTLCLNWDTLSQNVTAVDIPGNHFTALREPNVNVLAQRLRECMPSEYRVNP